MTISTENSGRLFAFSALDDAKNFRMKSFQEAIPSLPVRCCSWRHVFSWRDRTSWRFESNWCRSEAAEMHRFASQENCTKNAVQMWRNFCHTCLVAELWRKVLTLPSFEHSLASEIGSENFATEQLETANVAKERLRLSQKCSWASLGMLTELLPTPRCKSPKIQIWIVQEAVSWTFRAVKASLVDYSFGVGKLKLRALLLHSFCQPTAKEHRPHGRRNSFSANR